ncbi:hypothetical protein [Brevibacillus daliensis]|uniref:hypothetical protein n=1 Tax=Brevibacillus daliensis TaxID=2892995 RepID=UPI001E4EC53E|nr:hypothetical protein [Brevibacillus daliensis]
MAKKSRNSFTDPSPERQAAFHDELREAIGKRVLLLTAQFPSMFIGKILSVIEDFVEVKVEIMPTIELEDRIWYIHMDTINVYFIESDNFKIPKLR